VTADPEAQYLTYGEYIKNIPMFQDAKIAVCVCAQMKLTAGGH
jgi:hypothetical protein